MFMLLLVNRLHYRSADDVTSMRKHQEIKGWRCGVQAFDVSSDGRSMRLSTSNINALGLLKLLVCICTSCSKVLILSLNKRKSVICPCVYKRA